MSASFDAISAALTQTGVNSGTNVTGDITTVDALATLALVLYEASLSAGQSDSSIGFSTMSLEGNAESQVANAKDHSGAGAPPGSGTTGFVDLYQLSSPPTGANVTQSSTITYTGTGNTGNFLGFAVTFIGATGLDTPVRNNGSGVATLQVDIPNMTADDIAIAICCNGTAAPTVATGTSRGTATGDTSTASHGGIRIATNTGTGTVTIKFNTNSGDNSGCVGVRIIGASNPTGNRAVRQAEYVKEVGFVTNTTAGTTSVITVAAGGVPVGNTVIIIGACDNTGTVPSAGQATSITVTDTRGNQWNTILPQAIADPGAASAGQQGFICYCTLTQALLASDTITITYGNSTTAKAINAQEFRYLRTPLFDYATQNDQTGQSVSVAVNPKAAGQLVIGGVAVEGGTADSFTQDTDTTNGSWVGLTRRGSGTTTSGSTLNSVYKIVTASGAQTYDHATMLGTARDHCAMLAVFDVEPYDSRPDPFGRRTGKARRRIR